MQVAVFDFDGTSIEGSSPTQLVLQLIRDRKLSKRTTMKIVSWAIRYKWRLPQNEAWVRSLVFTAFEGHNKEKVDQYMMRFYDERIAGRFRPKADEAMRERAEEGCSVIVVSASFEPIVMRAMESHPFSHQISTRMKLANDGTYTRQVEGRPIEGKEKLIALEHWCDGHYGEGRWELAYAYGDHHSDETLLLAAKHPFAVSPNTGMSRIAKRRCWPVLDWSIDVPRAH